MSPDGKWHWNGSEWIPASPTSTPPNVSIDEEANVINESNPETSESETLAQQVVMQQPETKFQLASASASGKRKIIGGILVSILLLGSTAFFLTSPDSPLVAFRDSDNDGTIDANDEFPHDSSETHDSDNDGVGDNADDCPLEFGTSNIDRSGCPDDDGDGWSNTNDVWPNDPSRSVDSDGDGYADNNDLLKNGDAYLKFKAISLQTDSEQSYDDDSDPDMFIRIKIDLACDGSYETTLDSSIKANSHSVYSSDDMYVIYDIDDSRFNWTTSEQSKICFSIHVFDEDGANDDELDYRYNQGQSILFSNDFATGWLNEFSETLEYENISSGDYKSVNIEIVVSIIEGFD